MNLIKDKAQFENFTQNILPPLKHGEVYFVSLSARNKYLTEKERKEFALGRTEMFSRTLCYGDWNYAMNKMFATLDYKTTKSGLPYPEKALVVYVNINPSNMISASINFAKNVMNISGEMVNAYQNGKTPNLKQLDKADRLLMNYIQKSTGTRHYLDIDLDAVGSDVVSEFKNELDSNGVEHYVVQTQGGYHVLINRLSLNKSKYKLHLLVDKYDIIAKEAGGEVVFNSNSMIPFPGTLQAGKLVKVIDDIETFRV